MTEEKEIIPLTVSATEEKIEIPETPQEEAPVSVKAEVPAEIQQDKPAEVETAGEKPAEVIDTGEKPVAAEGDVREDEGQRPDRGRDDRGRYDRGHGGGRRDRDRPLTNEDKLRMYKKQSEERLLDIKRGKEAKVGKKRK